VGAGERAVDFTAHNVVIHFSTVFDGRTPVLCGASGIPCPAASERRYVSCPRCLARLGPVVHARRAASSPALCSVGPGVDRWTTRRSEVTCCACLEEIARRVRAAEPPSLTSPPRAAQIPGPGGVGMSNVLTLLLAGGTGAAIWAAIERLIKGLVEIRLELAARRKSILDATVALVTAKQNTGKDYYAGDVGALFTRLTYLMENDGSAWLKARYHAEAHGQNAAELQKELGGKNISQP
jgi:hypothetical protein